MRTSVCLGICVFGAMAALAQAQPELSIVVPPGGTTTLPQGGQVNIEVFINNVTPERLRAYQARLEVVPTPGATGTIGLSDITIDLSRPEFVFLDAGGVFPGINETLIQFGATVLVIPDAVSVTEPKYLAELVFKASSDAQGDFVLRFVLIDPDNPDARPTQLVDENGAQLPFTTLPVGGLILSVFSISSNDDCSQASTITDGATLFSTENTSTDGPEHPFSACNQGGTSSIDNDIWYDYTATCSGILSANTCGTADFDTRVAIYDGCLCPVSDANLLTCDDDANGCGVTSDAVVSGVFEGGCYKIRVGGTNGASGTGGLTVTCIGNDVCSSAEPLTPGVLVQGSTRNTAVNDTGVPLCGAPVDSPGVWYSVTGTGELLSASLSSGSFDTRLTVYEGSCGALACVSDVDNIGGNQETTAWCSTLGIEYFILIHANGGQAGPFALRADEITCDDGSVCTADTCEANTCVNTPVFDIGQFCCEPISGNLNRIDDENPCTTDTCNPFTGLVSHTPVADGPDVGCDDGFQCTVDECTSGSCTNTDVNTISCINDGDCPPDSLCISNRCFCDATPNLILVAEASGTLQVEGCFAVGDIVTVRVDLGPANVAILSPIEIVGAQFFLDYDTSTLDFLDIVPGAVVDPDSPFALEFGSAIDEVAGTIDYVIATTLGAGTRSPTTVAVMTFLATAECSAFVRYRPTGPGGLPNILTVSGGGTIDPVLIDLSRIETSNSPPVVSSCPADVTITPDAGSLTATVTWPNPTATDICDGGGVPVSCTPASGSLFAAGTTTVTCTATDSCGRSANCGFSVTVEPPIIIADIQLSPTVSSGSLDRCITFELWDCDAVGGPQSSVVEQTITFTSGLASNVVVPIPGGAWDCLSARDQLHTLRSTAVDFITTNGVDFSATFVGAWNSGGHWLLGGNLNNDNFIDIVDFAVFFPNYLTPALANTACGTPLPHSDINGDNVVDLLDLVFISGNSLVASQATCCSAGTLASTQGPRRSITLSEARRMGLGDLSMLDVDNNGVFDFDDVAAIVSGNGLQPGSDGDRVRPGKQGRRRSPHSR